MGINLLKFGNLEKMKICYFTKKLDLKKGNFKVYNSFKE